MNRLLLIPFLLCAAPCALGQEPPAPKPEAKPEIKPEGEHPVIHLPTSQDPNDLHQQMLKLFGEVETRLRQIDKLLSEAAAGERGVQDAQKPLDEAAAGIGALVKRTQDEGKAVVEAIDKILELAQQEEESQQGASGGKQSPGGKGKGPRNGQEGQQGTGEGKSPLEGQRDTTTQRENTPDKPGPGEGKTPQGQKPDQSGNPRGNKQTQGDGRNTQGKSPPGSETEKLTRGADARETWGYLPEHARDVFRTQGGGQMPARYREWIDAYYKKLNQKP